MKFWVLQTLIATEIRFADHSGRSLEVRKGSWKEEAKGVFPNPRNDLGPETYQRQELLRDWTGRTTLVETYPVRLESEKKPRLSEELPATPQNSLEEVYQRLHSDQERRQAPRLEVPNVFPYDPKSRWRAEDARLKAENPCLWSVLRSLSPVASWESESCYFRHLEMKTELLVEEGRPDKLEEKQRLSDVRLAALEIEVSELARKLGLLSEGSESQEARINRVSAELSQMASRVEVLKALVERLGATVRPTVATDAVHRIAPHKHPQRGQPIFDDVERRLLDELRGWKMNDEVQAPDPDSDDIEARFEI